MQTSRTTTLSGSIKATSSALLHPHSGEEFSKLDDWNDNKPNKKFIIATTKAWKRRARGKHLIFAIMFAGASRPCSAALHFGPKMKTK